MKNDSWVILHDISVPLYDYREEDLACRYLFSNVVSEEKLMPVSDIDSYFANIGAFKITEDTRKYIGNLFESLVIPWQAMPFFYDPFITWITPMLEEDLNGIRKIIKKYYPERYEFFENTVRLQNIFMQHFIAHNTGTKAFIKRNFPYLIKPLRYSLAFMKKLMRR